MITRPEELKTCDCKYKCDGKNLIQIKKKSNCKCWGESKNPIKHCIRK